MKIYLLLLSNIIGFSLILTHSELFHKFREWVWVNNTFFGKLITCYYCTCVWLSFLSTVCIIDKLSLIELFLYPGGLFVPAWIIYAIFLKEIDI